MQFASNILVLNGVQRARKRILFWMALLATGLILVVHPQAPVDSLLHESVEMIGIALVVLCVLGRTWTSLYIAGRKRDMIVDIGPFSVVRNPLYVFSVCGAMGVGFVTGSAVFGIIVAAATFAILNRVVRHEEAYLRDAFPVAFGAYEARVPRWLPRFSGWRGPEWLEICPAKVLTTFRDTSVFLLAVPAFELVEHLQQAGLLPVLLRIP